MKILLILGTLLLFLGMASGIIVGSKNNPGEKMSEPAIKLVRWSILIGFALMILSGILYLKS